MEGPEAASGEIPALNSCAALLPHFGVGHAPAVLHPSSAILFLLSVGGFLFFYRIGDRDLWSSHEARAAQDAQMVLDGPSWALPRLFDQQLELQKPPLYYWLVALAARLRGGPVTAWDVRFPAALSGLAGVLAVYLFGLRQRRPLAGLVAAAVLATSIHYTWLARTGRIDMPLALAAGVALGCVYVARRRKEESGRARWRWLLPAYGAIAVGVLLKGPIAVVLPASVMGMVLLLEGDLPAPWRLRRWGRLAHEWGLWWGAPLVAGLSAPWFIWAGLQTDGEFVRVFFWHHHFERAIGGANGMRARPWFLYAAYVTYELLPWSVFLPGAGWYFWRRCRHDGEARFGLAWFLTMLAVLSLARFKRADYLLPAYPGAALFLGCVAERWYRASPRPGRLRIGFGLLVAGCVVGWCVYLTALLPLGEPARESRRFAAEIRRRVPAPEAVLFFRTEAHALAFHVGPPINTFVEWRDLDGWAGRPGSHYVVMPAQWAAECVGHVSAGRLEEVLRSTDLEGAQGRERPLVLLRTRPRLPAGAP